MELISNQDSNAGRDIPYIFELHITPFRRHDIYLVAVVGPLAEELMFVQCVFHIKVSEAPLAPINYMMSFFDIIHESTEVLDPSIVLVPVQ